MPAPSFRPILTTVHRGRLSFDRASVRRLPDPSNLAPRGPLPYPACPDCGGTGQQAGPAPREVCPACGGCGADAWCGCGRRARTLHDAHGADAPTCGPCLAEQVRASMLQGARRAGAGS